MRSVLAGSAAAPDGGKLTPLILQPAVTYRNNEDQLREEEVEREVKRKTVPGTNHTRHIIIFVGRINTLVWHLISQACPDC